MEKTWRWFGRKDKITLPMLRQIGVEGIVTALHDVPNGEIWTLEAIKSLKDYIESHQLRWSVFRWSSLPPTRKLCCPAPAALAATRQRRAGQRAGCMWTCAPSRADGQAEGVSPVESILSAVIAGAVTLIGVLIANSRSQAVTDTKLEELTRKVREHNNFARRVPILEEQMKVANHRIADLEHNEKVRN